MKRIEVFVYMCLVYGLNPNSCAQHDIDTFHEELRDISWGSLNAIRRYLNILYLYYHIDMFRELEISICSVMDSRDIISDITLYDYKTPHFIHDIGNKLLSMLIKDI